MKLIKSLRYAIQGWIAAWKNELNLRIHCATAALVVCAGLYYEITTPEWLALLLVIAAVLSLELVNSAIETLADMITKDQHPLAGRAKDMAAGAVLCMSVFAVVIGLIIFSKYVF